MIVNEKKERKTVQKMTKNETNLVNKSNRTAFRIGWVEHKCSNSVAAAERICAERKQNKRRSDHLYRSDSFFVNLNHFVPYFSIIYIRRGSIGSNLTPAKTIRDEIFILYKFSFISTLFAFFRKLGERRRRRRFVGEPRINANFRPRIKGVFCRRQFILGNFSIQNPEKKIFLRLKTHSANGRRQQPLNHMQTRQCHRFHTGRCRI